MLSLRYVVFGLFITFSAVVASVAVWNLTYLQVLSSSTKERAIQVDCFLIFLGCFGLVVAFAILFTELAWRNAFTTSFCFELAWTSLCVLMELAGAIASTVIIPEQTCTNKTHGNLSCRSTKILMAFTWMNAILLLLYIPLLCIHVLLFSTGKNRVWFQNIHDLPPLHQRMPGSPAIRQAPVSSWKLETVLAPRPVHAAPPISMYSYRSGLGPEYRIEHFQPPQDEPGRRSPRPVIASQTSDCNYPPFRNALYPQYLQSTLASNQPSASIATPTPRQQISPTFISPSASDNTRRSPLGDWPRADIIKHPSERKKQPHESKMPMMDQKRTSASSSPSRIRPSGPRTSTSRSRPLDLTSSGSNVEAAG
ncbi:hypothetical protein E1B28_008717 [Marasmius oreades]|uniref:Uncharacterized protein n=1 Tax=Marasmius oreades TaxID=181124 RepID=A0A9P7US18_9AGAR|nr:uncharacterized protein E1B28_008717 [Marasmius oreades]KAG7092357.1 hypothetical protein E1B28_008717 [Marasmius oreades]